MPLYIEYRDSHSDKETLYIEARSDKRPLHKESQLVESVHPHLVDAPHERVERRDFKLVPKSLGQSERDTVRQTERERERERDLSRAREVLAVSDVMHPAIEI